MWSPHVILQINTPLNTIFWELNLSSMLLLWLSIFSIILICFSLVPAGLMKVPDDQKKRKWLISPPIILVWRVSKLPSSPSALVLPFTLVLNLYIFLFPSCSSFSFLRTHPWKNSWLFSFRRRYFFPWAIQVLVEVNEDGSLLKARRGTFQRFPHSDRNFTHWAYFL